MKIIDFTNKDCCLNCKNFTWWDGDYCCVCNMKIHQFGYGYQNGGYIAYPFMNENIDNTMETSETCEDYKKNNQRKWYFEEYQKFKEWQKIQNDYYKQIL